MTKLEYFLILIAARFAGDALILLFKRLFYNRNHVRKNIKGGAAPKSHFTLETLEDLLEFDLVDVRYYGPDKETRSFTFEMNDGWKDYLEPFLLQWPVTEIYAEDDRVVVSLQPQAITQNTSKGGEGK